MTEMTRTFGLELVEAVLTSYSDTFSQVLRNRIEEKKKPKPISLILNIVWIVTGKEEFSRPNVSLLSLNDFFNLFTTGYNLHKVIFKANKVKKNSECVDKKGVDESHYLKQLTLSKRNVFIAIPFIATFS